VPPPAAVKEPRDILPASAASLRLRRRIAYTTFGSATVEVPRKSTTKSGAAASNAARVWPGMFGSG
jgi:hypothetical protein